MDFPKIICRLEEFNGQARKHWIVGRKRVSEWASSRVVSLAEYHLDLFCVVLPFQCPPAYNQQPALSLFGWLCWSRLWSISLRVGSFVGYVSVLSQTLSPPFAMAQDNPVPGPAEYFCPSHLHSWFRRQVGWVYARFTRLIRICGFVRHKQIYPYVGVECRGDINMRHLKSTNSPFCYTYWIEQAYL